MSYISVELRHVLSCANDEGMILSLEKRSDSDSASAPFLRIPTKEE